MVLLSVLVTSFLEKALRVGQNSKSIEQSTQAYYYATSQIEKQLAGNENLKKKPWETEPITVGDSDSYSGIILTVHTGSSVIPKEWKGNSPFNSDYNLISLDKPVQLVIHDNIHNWSNVKFDFRIPAYSTGSVKYQTGSLRADPPSIVHSGALLWSLGNYEMALHASGSSSDGLFRLEEIHNKENETIADKRGYYYEGGNYHPDTSFLDFYNTLKNNQKCQDYACTFRLGMLRTIPATVQWQNLDLPYLEYRIRFEWGEPIPEQFMTLRSVGRVGKYQRIREVRIPQITTHTALDFAVLQ